MGHADFYPNGGGIQPGCFNNINGYIDPIQTQRVSINLCQREINLDDIKESTISISNVERFDFSKIFLICSHGRAYEYFTESITNGSCDFRSVECRNYGEYLKNRCNNCKTNQMGYKSTKPVKDTYYYLKTNKAENFCVNFQGGTASENNPYCANSAVSLKFHFVFYFVIFLYLNK